jgi:ribosomal protein S12 methylthiotransferase
LHLLRSVRETVPGITLRTSLIVGFPTETDEAFEELLSFVREAQFDRLGVFQYSQEENTTAHPLGDPVSAEIKQERFNRVMEAQREISLAHNIARVDTTEWVVVEEVEGDTAIGRSERDAPEIDNSVMVTPAGTLVPGDFIRVRITDATEYDVFGVRVE